MVREGQSASPQPAGAGRILFARNTLLGPTELYTVARDGSDERAVTRLNEAKVAAARFGKPEQFSFTGARATRSTAGSSTRSTSTPRRSTPSPS